MISSPRNANTYAKRQREAAKRKKAEDKRLRREQRKTEQEESGTAPIVIKQMGEDDVD